MQDYYTFPAVISKTNNTYGVYFYDLPGCIATGNTLDEVIRLAKDGLALHLLGMEEDGETVPKPTPIDNIKISVNEALCLLDANMLKARRENLLTVV